MHYSQVGDDANRIFRKLGFLIEKRSYLADEKTMVVEQIFSRYHYEIREKFKKMRSSSEPKARLKHIKFEIADNAHRSLQG